MKDAVIEVKGVGGEHFSPLDFSVNPGAAIILSSGSNAALNEFLEQCFGLGDDQGDGVCLAGEGLSGVRERTLLERLSPLGYVTGAGGMICNLKVWENLLLPLEARSGPGVEDRVDELEDQVIEAFSVASVPQSRVINMMPLPSDSLSPFERVLCGLVRCHLAGFRLLVCDRIFEGLDKGRLARVTALVDWMGERHKSTGLLVLHHSSGPSTDHFGLKGWSPIEPITLERTSWLAS